MTEPRPQGEDRIGAVPRDPESMLIYWELGGLRSAEVAREMGDACEWVLRILDLSEGTSSTIPIALEAGTHYLQVKPGRVYGAELAARVEGKWRTICRTERLVMPPGKPTRTGGRTDGQPFALGRGGRRAALAAAVRGLGVPGLDIESTPLGAGASSWGGSHSDA